MMQFYNYHEWVRDYILTKNATNVYMCEPENLKEKYANSTNKTTCEFFMPYCHLHVVLIDQFANNPSDVALNILNKLIDKLDHNILARVLINLCYNRNKNAIYILEKYSDKIKDYSWYQLNVQSSYEGAVAFCKKHNKIDWFYLSCNSTDSALELLCENIDKIEWSQLSSNKHDKAVKLLQENVDKIDWWSLSINSNDKVYDLLSENQDKIQWDSLAVNKSEKILGLLENNVNKLTSQGWERLSRNNSNKALEILEANKDKIDWFELAKYNYNDKAIKLIKDNLDKINGDMSHLFGNINPKAFELIVENKDSITSLVYLFSNPNIFVYNYEAIKAHMKNTWLTDLLKYWYHPKNMCKWADWGWW